MSEIPKAYEPQSVESKWYQFWLGHQCFVADAHSKKPAYSIVIPPPNVTGVLTLGHVLNNTIQDILARRARMLGCETLWLPGMDHAGIATERQVEKAVRTEEKKTKQDLGREEFIKRVWAWKEKHGGIIIQQLKKLGCSCDWSRERFTADPDYSRCVQKVFVELYKKGLIYRGKRMVNWCPASLTALSDEEVVMKAQSGLLHYFKVEVVEIVGQASRLSQTEKEKNENAGRQDACPTNNEIRATGIWLTIATTRPETIPGDTAVAVNPKDKRYAKLIGKHVMRPLPAELPREQKLIPIIGDEQIDIEFGTGVLKVTPAHDKADFEIGQRHKLPVIDIMNPDGTMNSLAGADLVGLDRFKARKVAAEKLKELGALEKEEPHQNNIGYSERADVPIEPRLSEQWFLKYPSVDKARACVEQSDEKGSAGAPPAAVGALADGPARAGAVDGASAAAPEAGALPDKMRFFPQRWAKVYDNWMNNIQDWCISRQLWWGHRIPVWYRKSEIRNPKSEIDTDDVWCENNPPPDPGNWEQDPDVLDTWFSSWLWPFATMGWTGDKSQDSKNPTLQTFYPTTDLVTAPDIIFFWVARMIMAGYEFMGQMPFQNVYFTGVIRDKLGRKMSKSLGNSPDPLDLIGNYGADALRFGIMRSAPLGQDVLYDEQHVELGRNFCNKLWNACRFRQLVGQASSLSPTDSKHASKDETGATPVPRYEVQGEINPALLTSDDKWILLKLDQAIREIDVAFAEYKFSEVTATLYRFFWSEYCDWYVEASKATLARPVESLKRGNVESTSGSTVERFNGSTNEADAIRANKLAVIDFVLSHTLRLFHPFLPFITEELWHGMGYDGDLPANQGGDTIMFAHWPKPLDDDFKAHYRLNESDERFVDAKYELVTRGRNLRREFNIAANKKVKFVLKVKDPLPPEEADVIKLLLNADALDVDPNFTPRKGTPSALTDLGELFLPLEGLVDIEAEKARLRKELAKIESEIEKVQSKLHNPDFVQKVPPKVLDEHKNRLADWQAKQQQIKAALRALGEKP
ncbi:MAG: valine--tRNA ligase [Verrucomicrobia bacterium]|nr:MAG: valine--tRNA ligase [Verrucomicrobiota bacterium]PYJ97293.1 MAG: valine--tRNA ligase [Verrucomicrobiota bacterium]